MDSKTTERLAATAAGIARAAEILSSGGLVAFPTETVYGLGADAGNGTAVAKVYAAKDRPAFNPLIVHFADIATVQKHVEWTAEAATLAAAFWPGPLTLVLPLRPDHGISSLVTAGQPSLAVRVPSHPIARQLLSAAALPVAAPSANPSGRISPTTADHVLNALGGRIDAVLDGGPCTVGLESTILSLADPTAVLLRQGGLPQEELEAALGYPLRLAAQDAPVTAPGQLRSHYAPRAPVRLNARHAKKGEVFLGFGACDGELNLSAQGSLVEAAANLFDHLHRLDRLGQPIAIAAIPDHGLGRAINDRLRRAAAPRDEEI